jgi:hypothetical protein
MMLAGGIVDECCGRFVRSVIVIGVTMATTACDKFMRLEMLVKDGSGAAVPGARVELVLPHDGRTVVREFTSDQGRASQTSAYGFRSSYRSLTVSKAGYKAYSADLLPRPGYRCEVLLRRNNEPEPTAGTCVPE